MKLPNIFERESDPVHYAAGETIFTDGQSGDLMYVVRAGTVSLRVRDEELETVEEEDFFGEMALIDSAPRSATAIAKTDCALVPIDQKRFLFMVGETPFFALEVMRKMSTRLRQINKRI